MQGGCKVGVGLSLSCRGVLLLHLDYGIVRLTVIEAWRVASASFCGLLWFSG